MARKEAAGGEAERAVGERSAEPGGDGRVESRPDPELVDRAKRRTFTAEYKRQILEEADACTKAGEIGALLRREGLYSSQLTDWRRQRERGVLEALGPTRGRPKVNPLQAKLERLRRRAERAEAELAQARKVIEVQGKVSALLGVLLDPRGETPNESSDG